MSRSRTSLDDKFYGMIEGRIVGSLKTCDRRRIYCANLEQAADSLLSMFYKKRDLGIDARNHIVAILSSSPKIIIEEEGAVVTVRLRTRREADRHRKQFVKQPRRGIDSRHTRARRVTIAAT